MISNRKTQRLLLIVTLVIAATVWQTQPAVASPAPMWRSVGKQRNAVKYQTLEQALLAEEQQKLEEEAKAKAAAEQAGKVSETVSDEIKNSLDRKSVLGMFRSYVKG